MPLRRKHLAKVLETLEQLHPYMGRKILFKGRLRTITRYRTKTIKINKEEAGNPKPTGD